MVTDPIISQIDKDYKLSAAKFQPPCYKVILKKFKRPHLHFNIRLAGVFGNIKIQLWGCGHFIGP